MHVVVVGLMASGKSTVAAALARALDRPLVDNDVQVAEATGGTAAAYASERGLEALHRLELEMLRRALAEPTPSVITAAASVGDQDDLDRSLAGHVVVWLDIEPAVARARVPASEHRPQEALDRLQAQHARRAPAFRRAADIVVPAGDATPDELVRRILAQLDLPR